LRALRPIALGVVWLGVLHVAASAALAQPVADGGGSASGVTTTVDPCVPVDPEQFQRVLSIELGTSIEYGADAPAASGLTTVHVTCSERGIELRLEDGITRKSMVRVLDPSRLEPASRTRLLALAVAEFVVASWVELRINEKPAVEPAGPRPDPGASALARRAVQHKVDLEAPPAETSEPAAAWELAALFRLEGWSSQLGLVPTFALRAGQRPVGHLGFTLGADLGFTRVSAAQGQVRITLGSLLGALLYVARAGDFDLSAGAGGRFGFVSMQGEASDSLVRGASFSAPFGGPLTLARAVYHASKPLYLFAEAEAGLVTLPATGLSGKRVIAEINGAWASVGLGIGLTL
jgi:hypothetical protein